MSQHGWRGSGCLLAATVVLLVTQVNRVTAADTETRDFTVLIDDKRAGDYHMTITRQDDGTVAMIGQADVRISYFIKTFTYTYRGTEIWKDGRLLRLDSSTNDDGKRYALSAVSDGQAVRVKVNGVEHATRPDVWVTTYWRLADAKFRNQAVPLLDADTGKDINATLQYVGTSPVNVGGQMQTCAHYRLTGGVQVDVWYDAQEHLVRQTAIEEGHRTALELRQIRR
jgi:hypothetical protein